MWVTIYFSKIEINLLAVYLLTLCMKLSLKIPSPSEMAWLAQTKGPVPTKSEDFAQGLGATGPEV